MINITIDVFSFDTRAQRKVLYKASTEISDMACLDVGSIQKTMQFLYPKMVGLTVTIM